MIILGLSGAGNGNAAAALLIDQTVVAAMEEAPLSRVASSPKQWPLTAARHCLQQAGIHPASIDAVAIAAAPCAFNDPHRWHYVTRLWHSSPRQALRVALEGNRPYRMALAQFRLLLAQLGMDDARTPLLPVEPALAQAAAGYYLSEHPNAATILGFHEGTHPTGMLTARADNGHLKVHSRMPQPDSLMRVMLAMAAYLGFDSAHALEGIALLARQGDARRYDLGRLFSMVNGALRANLQFLDISGQQGWQHNGKRYPFTQKLVDWLGPPAAEAAAIDPHVHYAAALQQCFGQTLQAWLAQHPAVGASASGPLLLCGEAASGRALIPSLQQAGNTQSMETALDLGATSMALGAAAQIAAQHGILVESPGHAYWGPEFCIEECMAACRKHASRPAFEVVKDPARKAARLLADGHAVGWFQGRAESGTLPLGARALLYSPTSPQRPALCSPSGTRWTTTYWQVLSILAAQQARYTPDTAVALPGNRYVGLNAESAQWLPQDLQINGSAALHTASKKQTPRLHALLDALENMTGHGMVMQMPLQLPGEPRVCAPMDALDWLAHGPADYLLMEDLLVRKTR